MPIYPVADDKTRRPRTLDQLRASMEDAHQMCEAINLQTIRYGDPNTMRYEEGVEFPDHPHICRIGTKMTMPRSMIAYYTEVAEKKGVSCVGVGIQLARCLPDQQRNVIHLTHGLLPWVDFKWGFWSDIGERDRVFWSDLLLIAQIDRRRLRPPWETANRNADRRISGECVHALVGAFVALANANFEARAVKELPEPMSATRGRGTSRST